LAEKWKGCTLSIFWGGGTYVMATLGSAVFHVRKKYFWQVFNIFSASDSAVNLKQGSGRFAPTHAQLTISTSGFYHLAKVGWTILEITQSRIATKPLCENWPQNPQNRKYITYRSAVRGGPIHNHRQRAQKFGKVQLCGFWVMRMDRQTASHTDRQTKILINNSDFSRSEVIYSVQYFSTCRHTIRVKSHFCRLLPNNGYCGLVCSELWSHPVGLFVQKRRTCKLFMQLY